MQSRGLPVRTSSFLSACIDTAALKNFAPERNHMFNFEYAQLHSVRCCRRVFCLCCSTSATLSDARDVCSNSPH